MQNNLTISQLIFRIDGAILNVSQPTSLSFNDDDVKVDINPNSDVSDVSAVVIVNVQFKNGKSKHLYVLFFAKYFSF